MPDTKPILISACLLGVRCRYDADSKPIPEIEDLLRKGLALPVCPEQIGGLPTPRPACERRDDKVFGKDGSDLTEQFMKGAHQGLELALKAGCTRAILKARSPSCGCSEIYDGTFSGRIISGDGVFAQLLKEHDIQVETELNFTGTQD